MYVYAEVVEREDTFIVDGYSNAKTLTGVMNDIARIMKKVSPREESTFMTRNKKESEELLTLNSRCSQGGFFVDIEEVPCACMFNDETNECEYKEGYNYYFCTRVVK